MNRALILILTLFFSTTSWAISLDTFLPETVNKKDLTLIEEKIKGKKANVFYKKNENIDLPPKVEIIFDGSGSMGQMLSKTQSKMYISKEILQRYLEKQWQEKALIGLRVYGAQKKNSCKDSKLLINFSEKSLSRIQHTIKNLGPLGMTPLHTSIKLAVNDLKDYPGPKRVVILTDGEDTCGGDPCKTAEFLKSQPELNIKFYTIGIGFAGEGYNLKNMTCLGPVLNAESEEDLEEGLDRVDKDIFSKFKNLQVLSPDKDAKVNIYTVKDGKKKLVRTFTAREKIRLEPGVYRAEVKIDPTFVFKKFKIKKNRRTLLKIKGQGYIYVKYHDKLLTVDVIDVHDKVVKSGTSNEKIIMPMGQYHLKIYSNPFYEMNIPSFFLNPNAKREIKITDGTSYVFKNKQLKGFHVYKGTNKLLGKYLTNAKGVIFNGVYRFYLDKSCDLKKVIFDKKDKFKTVSCQ